MKRSRAILGSLVCLSLALADAWAQSPQKEEPAPPFVDRLKPNIEWTAKVQPKKARLEPKTEEEIRRQQRRDLYWPQLESCTGYRNEEVVHITYFWRGGKKTEGYVVDGVLYRADNPNFPDYVNVNDPQGQRGIDFRKSDFPELHWVDLSTFVEETTEKGRRCYFYRLPAESEISGGLEQLAWIDKETRWPVKRDDGINMYAYSYKTVAPRAIIPPPEYQRLIRDTERAKADN